MMLSHITFKAGLYSQLHDFDHFFNMNNGRNSRGNHAGIAFVRCALSPAMVGFRRLIRFLFGACPLCRRVLTGTLRLANQLAIANTKKAYI